MDLAGSEQFQYWAVETEFGAGLGNGLAEVGIDGHDSNPFHELGDDLVCGVDRFLKGEYRRGVGEVLATGAGDRCSATNLDDEFFAAKRNFYGDGSFLDAGAASRVGFVEHDVGEFREIKELAGVSDSVG